MTHLIDWKSWLLAALARRIGFPVQQIGMHPVTGARAFICGTNEQCCAELAENVYVQHQIDLARRDRIMAQIDKIVEQRAKTPAVTPGRAH